MWVGVWHPTSHVVGSSSASHTACGGASGRSVRRAFPGANVGEEPLRVVAPARSAFSGALSECQRGLCRGGVRARISSSGKLSTSCK